MNMTEIPNFAIININFGSIFHVQMNKFRDLSSRSDGSIMVDNYRRLQPIRNRHVFVRHVNVRDVQAIDETNEVHYSKWNWIF